MSAPLRSASHAGSSVSSSAWKAAASSADGSETYGFSGALQLERVMLRRIRAPFSAAATQVPWPSAMCESMTTATPM